MLIDTGPIVALIDKADQENHQKCSVIFQRLTEAPLTTWACLTEAFYFLFQIRGWNGQRALLFFLQRGAIRVYAPNDDDLLRIAGLMEQYKDTPMDFADASLVALAERAGTREILSFDDDFFVYLINGKDAFEVCPVREPK